ncbi:hypothetical protein RI543_002556 [Arxiozyma heterogenica]|uniref:mitogen-activated protein kinase kinase n=1 Tax=Arxiozyma heterogenica TaxID=278026 RepID=A0AAN7ZXW3_9SACH|nr:hypothetical protein RI543_002556 [Kazachstania heterogenica]
MASLFRPPESHRSHSNAPKLKLPSLINDVSTPSPNRPIFKDKDEPKTSISYKENVSLDVPIQTDMMTSGQNNTKRQLSPNIYTRPTNSKPNQAPSLSLPTISPISSTHSSKSPITLKNRPLPPPIPQLNINIISESTSTKTSRSLSSQRNRRPSPPMVDEDLSNALKNISITTGSETISKFPVRMNNNDTHMSNNNSNSSSNNNTSNSNHNSNKPLYLMDNLADSTDSYFSTIISSYEDGTSESTNNSPQKNNTKLSNVIERESQELDSILIQRDVDQLDESVWKDANIKNQIVTLGMLGEGAGGSVAKCRLKTGSKIFALKTINILNTDPEFQKQIFRELQFNRSFKSDYIVRYYGMFRDELNCSIYIAMEYMGGKSLDAVYKNLLARGGRISEKVLGKIAEDVLRGLSYLHEKKVIHRDIKPQNILFNEKGEVKLCDFGVSGEAVNSLATTFTGTSFYMAPERIQGEPYSVTCDVWSLGLTILEVAQGHFPFGSEKITVNIAPIELLVMILTFTPELRDEPENNISWSNSFKSFVEYCLKKDPKERPSPRQMLKHPWIQGQMKKNVNMAKFIKKCWEDE